MSTTREIVGVSVALPAAGACANCVARLEKMLLLTPGVAAVVLEGVGSHAKLRVELDPQVVSFRRLEELATEACSRLENEYAHESLMLKGLDCADCAAKLEGHLSGMDGVLSASVNFATSRLTLEYERGRVDPATVRREVGLLGYAAFTDTEYRRETERIKARPFYLRSPRALVTAASLAFLVVGIILWNTGPVPRIAAILVLAAAIVASGYSIARNGLLALVRTHSPDMNILMTLAVIGAAAVGEWIEGALVVALFGLGETLEGWAVDRTRRSIHDLMDLSPAQALVRLGSEDRAVPVEDVRLGDSIAVRPGARVPLDALVLEGASAVDESAITGEFMPKTKEPGDRLFAGSMNREGYLLARVTAAAGETTLARIVRLVEDAQTQKAPAQRWVDRFARYYTPAVMAFALLTALAPPLLLGASWSEWIYKGLALLILACPCALVISTPVAVVSALGAAGRQGVLIKGGAYLEAAASANVVAFDKTGTLTMGRPVVVDIQGLDRATPAEALVLAASLELRSEHPLAEAVVAAAQEQGFEPLPVAAFRSVPGKGVVGRIDGVEYAVGSREFMAGRHTMPGGSANAVMPGNAYMPGGEDAGAEVDPGASAARAAALYERWSQQGLTAVFLANDGGPIAAFAVADEPRAGAAEAIAELRRQGVTRSLLLTGDNPQAASALAASLGIDEYRADLLPEDKVGAVRGFQEDGAIILMVGDGVNDAPALAAADVGLAMGGARNDIALQTADIVLMNNDLENLPFVVRLARDTLTIVRQNIGFALALKVAATALVFPGILTLWMAVLVDTGGSLLVIGNGLRLLRRGRRRAEVEASNESAPASLSSS